MFQVQKLSSHELVILFSKIYEHAVRNGLQNLATAIHQNGPLADLVDLNSYVAGTEIELS